LEIKIVERRDSQRILILHTGKANPRKVIGPIEYLFDRIRFGKSLPNKCKNSSAIRNVEQQCQKETMLRIINEAAAPNQIFQAPSMRKNSSQNIALIRMLPFRNPQKLVKPLVRFTSSKHLLD